MAHDIPWMLIKKVSAIFEFFLNCHNLIVATICFTEGGVTNWYGFGEYLFSLWF